MISAGKALKRPPHMRHQADASEDFLRASMYWLAGLTNRAMISIDRSLNQPDRMGFTSVDPRQAQAGHALVRLPVDPGRRGVADSIVARMERAGGHARIHSSVGAGTEVELSLPLPDHEEVDR